MTPTDFTTGNISPIEIYKETWELIKGQYWLIFSISLVGMIIGGIVPVILMGPMICGIYLCLFQKIEGQEVKFDTLFKGFEFFMPGLIVSLIITVPIFALILTIYVPMIGMAIAGPRMSESELIPFIIGILVVEVIVAFIMVCFHTLLMFAFPLIVDRKLSGWQSVKVSASAVWHNLAGVVGLIAVGMVVAIIGYLLLCVGLYFVLPLILASNAVAYRKIFPRMSPGMLEPPPPSAYQG